MHLCSRDPCSSDLVDHGGSRYSRSYHCGCPGSHWEKVVEMLTMGEAETASQRRSGSHVSSVFPLVHPLAEAGSAMA